MPFGIAGSAHLLLRSPFKLGGYGCGCYRSRGGFDCHYTFRIYPRYPVRSAGDWSVKRMEKEKKVEEEEGRRSMSSALLPRGAWDSHVHVVDEVGKKRRYA